MAAPHCPSLPMLVVAVLLLTSCAEVARAPSVQTHSLAGADGAPLIGRLRMRDQTLDLTRTSIRAGGPAHDAAQGVAQIIADIDESKRASSVDERGPMRRSF